jgi:hypothetical protein
VQDGVEALASQMLALGILIGYCRPHPIATPHLPHAADHGMSFLSIAEK